MGRERRTHPSFLSNSEAARESRRTSDVVRSITGTKKVVYEPRKKVQSLWRTSPQPKPAKLLPKWKGTKKMGETDRFIVDRNFESRLIRVYGKELRANSLFKLNLTLTQTIDVIDMLTIARKVIQGKRKLKIDERSGYVVVYDGNLVTLFKKEGRDICPFKLAFDKVEIIKVTYLLRKALSFF